MSKTPGRFSSSVLRRRWIVPVVVPVVVLGAAVTVWLAVRGSGGSSEEASRSASRKAADSARRALDPMSYVRARADIQSSTNLNELIQAYGVWATRSEALAARKEIVRTLLGHSSPTVGLQAVLTAVESDQTPREHDPMWDHLVKGVAALWDAATLKYGRDLVMIEERPKPRDLVLESLAHVRPERLMDDQRPLLASDFIDLYATLKPNQKPLINRALHGLAGSDVVEIMAGRGLTEGSTHLNVAAERQRALEEVKRNPVREAPAEE